MAIPLRVASGSTSAYLKSLPKSKRQYGTAPMPDFIEPQLAKLVAEPPKGSDWVHEIKFDSYRMQARVRARDKHYCRSEIVCEVAFED
jgi:ATP-dependent DNA ligase